MGTNVPVLPLTRLDTSSAVDSVNENFRRLSDALDRVLIGSGYRLSNSLDANGRSILNLPDATSPNQPATLRQLLNNPGQPGSPGPAGRSITSVALNSNGHLIVSFSDGTTQDAGFVGSGSTDPDLHRLLTPVIVRTTGDDNFSLAYTITLPPDDQLPDTGYLGFGLKCERATDSNFTLNYVTETNLINSVTFENGDSDFTILNGLTVGVQYYIRFTVVPPTNSGFLASAAASDGPVSVLGNGSSNLNPVITLSGDSFIGNTNPVDATAAPYSGFYVGYFIQQHSGHTWRNYAKGGQGLVYFEQQLPSILAEKSYIHYDDQGRNDFMDAAIVNYSYNSEQELFDAYTAKRKQLWDQITAQGTKLITNTLTERHASDNESYNQIYNRWRKTYNTWVRSLKTSGYLYDIVDYGGDSTVGADGAFLLNSLPITSDGLHFYEPASDATHGHGIAYSYFKPVFENALDNIPLPGGSTGDDDVSSFAISPSNVTHAEGNSGTTTFAYTITRSGGTTYAAAVDYAITGTAANSTDISTPLTGTVTFASNATTATLNVLVNGDTTVESDETFTVTISNGRTFGNITTATATGTITNDDSSGGGSQPVGYSSFSSYEGSGGFASSFTFPNALTFSAAGIPFIYIDSFGDADRQAATVTLTPSGGGSAINLSKVQTGYGLWQATSTVPAGSYTLAMTSAGNTFAYVGMLAIVATNASPTLASSQVQPQANRNNPITFGASQVVGTNALGFEFLTTKSSVSSRPDGSTERGSIMVNDTSFGGVHYISVATLPSTATPSYNLSGGVGDSGVAITVAAA